MIAVILLWLLASACFAACPALLRGHAKRAACEQRRRVEHMEHSPIAIRFVALNDECAAARLISRIPQTAAGER